MSEKKIIRVYLSPLVEELKEDRLRITDFIYTIGKQFYKAYGVDIQPFSAADISSSDFIEGLKECDFVFFIFFTELGADTEKEFSAARELLRKNDGKKPKIYTYFKNLSGNETMQDSLKDFVRLLETEIGHYYRPFFDVDTVKLRLLESIVQNNLDFLEMKAENGFCVINGEQIMPLANVNEFFNNKNLADLKSQLERAEEEYFRLKPEYNSGKCSDEIYSRYCKAATNRQNLKDQIEELEGAIFKLSMSLVKDEVRGEITPRQREAYRQLEAGNLEGALAVFEEAEMDADFEAAEKQMSAKAGRYIKEYRTMIEVLTAMTNYEKRFAEIERVYEKIIPTAEKYLVEVGVIYDYADYLHAQNKGEKALAYARKLEEIYTAGRVEVAPEDKANLCNLIGLITLDIDGEQDVCEKYLLEAMEIREGLTQEAPERFGRDLAESYNNIAELCARQNRLAKAEEYGVKAIEIREEMARENPEEFSGDLAMSYNNIAILYSEQGQPKKAEEYYVKAIEICKKLARENPERFSLYLAMSYHNIAVLYSEQGQPKKAEEYHVKDIEIEERLVHENPEKFSDHLAMSYNSIAGIYRDQGQPKKAEEYYIKAIEIREKLARENPEKFGGDLAWSYNNTSKIYDDAMRCSNMAWVYSDQGQPKKAEEYYVKAIEIWERLDRNNPDRFGGNIAVNYNNIAVLYSEQGQPEKAEEYYVKAIAIRERLVQENPEQFSEDLADSYNNIAQLYRKHGRPEKAEEYYIKAIEIRVVLTRENPERFSGDLWDSYTNITGLYEKQGQPEKQEEYYIKAIEIWENLVQENPERFSDNLAVRYGNIAVLYSNQGQPKKAEEYYIRAIEIRERLARDNPGRFSGDLVWSYGCIAGFYEKQGQPEKAAEYRTKALNLAKTQPDDPTCKMIMDLFS